MSDSQWGAFNLESYKHKEHLEPLSLSLISPHQGVHKHPSL